MKYSRQQKSGLMAFLLASAIAGNVPAHSDWKPSPDAIQRIYINGVPQIDKNGHPLPKYDAAKSFLPISIYHAIETENGGVQYKLADLKKAGFNCAFAWPGQGPTQLVKAAEAANLPMIFWNPEPEEVKKYKDSPAIMGYCLDDEPIGYLGRGIEDKFAKMQERRNVMKANDPNHPVMLVDSPWIQAPATAWWIKLNTEFDISSHDNYPLDGQRQSLSHVQGIPESISLAVGSNKEKKPLWFVMQSFEWLDPRFNAIFPTVNQQRAMMYTSLIHGATGIVHFSLDSFVTRESRVIGISPDPKPKYSMGLVATQSQMQQSRDLWNATVQLNKELEVLRPALLSPTADIPYEISLDDRWKSISTVPVRSLLKLNPAGGATLILVNLDSTPQKVKVRFPDKKFAMKELFNPEGANLLTREGEADNFEFLTSGYDTRIFQIDWK